MIVPLLLLGTIFFVLAWFMISVYIKDKHREDLKGFPENSMRAYRVNRGHKNKL